MICVVVCLKFVQVSYELFFIDFVIFLQCGKGSQVRQQSRSFTDSIRQGKFWCLKLQTWATHAYCAACTNRQHEIDQSPTDRFRADGFSQGFNELWKELQSSALLFSFFIVIPRVNTRQAVVLWAFKLAGYWSVIPTEWCFWKDMVIFWQPLFWSHVLQTMAH